MTLTQETIFCANHPTVATSLRCNRCEKPICTKCAVLTPTGYRCKQCVGSQQKVFDNALWHDYVLGFGLAAVLSFIGSVIIILLPLALLTFLVAPLIGTIIGEVVRRVTQKRRSKRLFWGVAGSVLAGGLPILLFQLVSSGLLAFNSGMGGFGFGVFSLIWQGVYLFLAVTTAYYRLSGITLRF
jgi:hypothetical protein